MSLPASVLTLVVERANGRCEYCHMHSALQGATFHAEHVFPSSRGGSSEPDNLAWACPGCNLHKSDQCEAIDPLTQQMVALFHPRRNKWSDHFRIEGYVIVGLTPTGRATAAILQFNLPRRLLIRQAEEVFGLFPPPEG